MEGAPSDFVPQFAGGLSVIRTFDAANTHLSLNEVAQRAEIPPAKHPASF